MKGHALYQGRVWHRRLGPVEHRFSYPLWWAWINLDQVDGLLGQSRWWGRRWRPAVFRDQDFGTGSPDMSLAQAAREQAGVLGLDWERGDICLLAQPRLFGWQFNPLALYWHFPDGADTPDSALAEVHNTPWHERHWYALPLHGAGPWSVRHPKAFHVSPFMAMDQDYHWRIGIGTNRLDVRIANREGGARVFEAGVDMERISPTADALRHFALARGWQGMAVSGAIYAQALRLWRKGVPFVTHPRRRDADDNDNFPRRGQDRS